MTLPKLNTHIINTFAEFLRLVKYAEQVKSEYIVLDVETNSEIEKKASLYGIGVCFIETRAFYIQWRNQQGQLTFSDKEQQDIVSWLKLICSKKKLIGHNIIYDILVMYYQLGVNLTEFVYSDTILLKHTIEEEPPFSLKELAVRDLGPGYDKAQQILKDNVIKNGGSWNEKKKDMYLADTEVLAEYCMWDVVLTLLLFYKYDNRVHEEGLQDLFYKDEIMDLYREVTIPMKLKGFTVDVPYFETLKSEIEELLVNIEEEILEEIKEEVKPFTDKLLDKEAPMKTTGLFPKFLADSLNIPLPVAKKTGKVSLAEAGLRKQLKLCPEHSNFYKWILEEEPLALDKALIERLRVELFLQRINAKLEADEPQYKYVFNLNSNKHLAYYFFEVKKYEARGLTETGQKSVNATFIEELRASDPKAQKIIDFKKLQKILSTYVNGILTRQIDGIIYTSLLQHGTTSGRYSSRNPNLQNSPRIKDEESGLSELVLKYVNAIRKGFISPPGYKIVNADFAQLEPCCFASASGDKKLQEVFHKKEDLYSRVSIDVFKMHHLSADKSAPNYLKKVSPEFRNKSKQFSLAVPYGAEASRIAQLLGCERKEAAKIIQDYLSAYPDLKKYMQDCDWSAKKTGQIKNSFGRIRHLKEAKNLFQQYGNNLLDWRWAKSRDLLPERRKFKTLLNNAKNFPIQSLAAHIVNRAAVAIAREFKRQGLDAHLILQIHDELLCIAKEDITEKVKQILKDCMENTVKIAVPLVAEPLIATNWAEAK